MGQQSPQTPNPEFVVIPYKAPSWRVASQDNTKACWGFAGHQQADSAVHASISTPVSPEHVFAYLFLHLPNHLIRIGTVL